MPWSSSRAGPERARLEELARDLGVRATFTGDRPLESVLEAYVAGDVFALLSTHEPWGVVVNEAAACGLPLVLSDRVGAAYDLLRDSENGFLVPAGDVGAAARALAALDGPGLRATMGAALARARPGVWLRPVVDNLLAGGREATAAAEPRRAPPAGR